MLGALDDPSDFDPADPLVRDAWTRNPHWRVPRTGLVLEALVAACIEQKVTGQEAFLGWRRLVRRFGLPAPGPGAERGMLTLPTRRGAGSASRRGSGCAVTSTAPARPRSCAPPRVADSLERTVGLPGDEVERRLTSLPGVGVWTAAEVRQRAHGDADAVSFGDYHIARHVGWALTGEDVRRRRAG